MSALHQKIQRRRYRHVFSVHVIRTNLGTLRRENLLARLIEKQIEKSNPMNQPNAHRVFDSSGVLALENPQILLAWFGLATFVIVFIMGISNKVIIFDDLTDFFISCGPVYLSITGFIIFSTLDVPALNSTLDSMTDVIDIISYDQSTLITSLALGIAISACLFISLRASISNNGLLVGLVVFLFKFSSSAILSILVIAKFKDLLSQKSTFATRFAATVLLGIFAWLINALVNLSLIHI